MNGLKILIADDEERMRRLVSDFLKKHGYQVVEACNGAEALRLFNADRRDFALLILDVMMPALNGWEVLKEIRSYSSIPVIMLTAKSSEDDELYGFKTGADEYITKPFSPMVLVARVQALLKRAAGTQGVKAVFNGLVIDGSGHSVYVNGESIELTPKEFELLLYLANNKGIALSRDMILNSVWDYDYFGDERTVDTHIKKLRLKLRDIGSYIQTIRGFGYKFEVTE